MQSCKDGSISISIATNQSTSSQSMIDAIKEGVTHGKMGGDGMAGREVSADSSDRAPGKPDERYLQSVDPLTLSVK